ncbi:MAG: Crp/Fnr family transcriptional regulator, partial [Fulvivirga sp.]|nr:Crp/Fnr family transcriptional regulator [Fulvivirga sp.]
MELEKSKFWYLEQFNMMKKLSKDDMMYLKEAMTMKQISADTMLYFPERAEKFIYFLKEGTVKIAHYTEDGQEDIKAIVGPGNIFGELGLVGGESPNDYAVAMEDCLICFIDVATMRDMMEKNEALRTEIHKIMGLRIKRLERRLESIIFKDSKTRILEFLEDFKHDYGKIKGEDIVAKNFLTHADMAKLTATSRQTVTTVLNELRADGWI